MNPETFINDIPTESARSAYAGVSFTPERRAEQVRSDYANLMAADYAVFAKMVESKPDLKAAMEAEFERYRQGYRTRLLKKLASDSRCVSWMIAGPSNFPVRRMEKRNETAHKRLEELLDYRSRAKSAIGKVLCPELRPIMSGDADAVARLTENIAEAEKLQAQMKAINAAHKAFLQDPASLEASDFSDEIKARIRNYKPNYSWEPHPVAPCTFTNHSANLRRMKKRLEHISKAKTVEATTRQGELARLEDCPAENRIRLFFPGKPDEVTRSRLKSAGFRWIPSLGCWQAYRNYRAMEQAKKEINP